MFGGTFLGTTNKGNLKAKDKIVDQEKLLIDGYHQLGLDGLIIIGGDGSMNILQKIAKKGNLKIVAIPKTIDNDVGATDFSIGFDTVCSIGCLGVFDGHTKLIFDNTGFN